MKDIRIKSISCHNFKALRRYDLTLDEADADIYAENGVGKTTLLDSWLWIITDKNSESKKDFSVKTLQASGESVSGFEHEVGVRLVVDNKEVELKRIYHEVYTKKRGSARDTFTGHTSDYFVDDIKVSEKEFRARVADICDETTFRMLTDLTYFNTVMKWEDRRKLLVTAFGDVTDADVIAANKDLAGLPEVLGERSIDDHKKWLAERRKEINDELKELPARIDETERGLPETSGTPESIESDLLKIRTAIQEKHQERARLDSGGEVAEKKRQLSEARAELQTIETAAKANVDEQNRAAREAAGELDFRIGTLTRKVAELHSTIESNQSSIKRLEDNMDGLREEWQTVSAEIFADATETVCPACEQDLPADRVQEAKDKALAIFNAARAKHLERIDAEGKQYKAEAAELALFNERFRKEIQELEAERDKLADEKANAPALEIVESDSSAGEHLLGEIAALEDEIAKLGIGNTDALAAITAEITDMQHQIKDGEAALAAFKQREQGRKRIDDLKARESELSAEYEEYERQLFLVEGFIQAQAAMLTESINGHFKLTRWKLFDQQINEGIKPCCVATMDGVPFPDLNTGSQIRVGLDIIATLSEHYGIVCPIFVDHAESITGQIEAPGQLIRLIASENDKELRVETRQQEAVKNG